MITVRDMTPEDEYFVSTCSHISENEEQDACGKRRLTFLRNQIQNGLKIKVALIDDRRVGFIYTIPIELMPWGFSGHNLMCFPCIWIIPEEQKKGIGTTLLNVVEHELKNCGAKGIATLAYFGDFWFMPVSWFEKRGYECVNRRGSEGIMLKRFSPDVEPPVFLEPNFTFEPVPGKVTVDVFCMTFCQTSEIEAQRVREVVAEFEERVVLREYNSDDQKVLGRYQIPRAIFVDGKEIGWGYEAPREGIREAINKALENKSQ